VAQSSHLKAVNLLGRRWPDHFALPEFVASFLQEFVEESWRINQDIACRTAAHIHQLMWHPRLRKM
jgi:hypothetical protein